MIDLEKIKYVIEEIVTKDYNYPLAWKILDYFNEKAKTIEDYNSLGQLSMIAKYDAMRLSTAENVYTLCSEKEDLYLARENLIQIYNSLNMPEKALFYVDLNLKVKPGNNEMLMHRAYNLALLGQREAAEEILSSIVPENEKQRESLEYSLSGRQLRSGHTAAGIRNFITKFKPENPLFEKQLKLQFWQGGAQPGKTIVINGEGGVGDEIINLRFLKWFTKMGMKPILYSSWGRLRPDLVKLFRRHGHEVTTVTHFFEKDYLWTHMMALPGYMGLAEHQLWTGPYLTPLRQEKNQLNDNNFKIGIKCNGNPYFEQDIYRSIPIEEMLAVLPKNASIYYFDKEKTHPACINLQDRIKTWDDTLDFIDQMDVIFSSCTSLVHAAGAMGKRTIVMVPMAEYYVWTSTKADGTSPWYGDHVRILRQKQVRDWAEPLTQGADLIKGYMCA